PEPGAAAQSERRPALLRELAEDRQRPRRLRRVALLQGGEPETPAADQGRDLPHLPEPLPGERRRDETVRPLREVPEARLPGEEGHHASPGDPARTRWPVKRCPSRSPSS